MKRFIVHRPVQLITSDYGKRPGFSKPHEGVDLRTYSDGPDGRAVGPKNAIVLPESAILKRAVYEEKWGWTYIFDPLETEYYEIGFTHMHYNDLLTPGLQMNALEVIGYSIVTPYMIKHNYGGHVHFSTKLTKSFSDPKIYMQGLGIQYDYKKG